MISTFLQKTEILNRELGHLKKLPAMSEPMEMGSLQGPINEFRIFLRALKNRWYMVVSITMQRQYFY
jgi:hypothetical protein